VRFSAAPRMWRARPRPSSSPRRACRHSSASSTRLFALPRYAAENRLPPHEVDGLCAGFFFARTERPPAFAAWRAGRACRRNTSSAACCHFSSNFRSDRGEIDLIVRDQDCLVFVEGDPCPRRLDPAPLPRWTLANAVLLSHAAFTTELPNPEVEDSAVALWSFARTRGELGFVLCLPRFNSRHPIAIGCVEKTRLSQCRIKERTARKPPPSCPPRSRPTPAATGFDGSATASRYRPAEQQTIP